MNTIKAIERRLMRQSHLMTDKKEPPDEDNQTPPDETEPPDEYKQGSERRLMRHSRLKNIIKAVAHGLMGQRRLMSTIKAIERRLMRQKAAW